MSKDEYLNLIKGLPIPTKEQYERFADHVFVAHSWYKHLPLGGALFVFCLAPDSGTGRQVAVMQPGGGLTFEVPKSGAEYTDENPRLHHSWQTTSEYRKRFGFLEFLFRTEGESRYTRDAGLLSLSLPDELEKACLIELDAAASKNLASHKTLLEGLDDASVLPQAEDWPFSPELFARCNEAAIVIKSAADALIAARERITDEQRERLENRTDDESLKSDPQIVEYLQLEQDYFDSYNYRYDNERAKVIESLARLDQWLRQNL